MPIDFQEIMVHEVSHDLLQNVGNLTQPRSWGVYELPSNSSSTRRFRFGNHPVRQHELQREFQQCTLRHLFLVRENAKAVADALNAT